MSIRGGRGPREEYVPPIPEPASTRRPNGYKRTGRYGRGPGDQRRFERYGDPGGGAMGVIRFLVFLIVLAAVVLVALFTVARPVARLVIVPFAEGNPAALRISFVEDLVREDLGGALTQPGGTNPSDVEFIVEPGDTAETLAPRLLEDGLISSERAFLFEARMRGLTPLLTAGKFRLAATMTPGEVVTGLVENRIVVETAAITFREGLRIEQMVAKLQTVEGTKIDPKAFYELAMDPPDELLADFPWLLDENVRPKGASLEGFLYPATYTVRIDADATDAEGLIRMMLKTFYDRVGQERLDVPEKRGLSFYEVLTLASIVEREAVLDEERPLIAGVYQNRIDKVPSVKHGLLQADPTVIYAVDTVNLGKYGKSWAKYVFWTVPEGPLKDQQLPDDLAGYNTYAVPGLPPGPIVTPSLPSIEAALKPDTKSGYTYFVAIPDGDGAHDFSKSAQEHEKKLRKYGYI